MSAPENYYELLGFEPSASPSQDEIRASYRALLKVTGTKVGEGKNVNNWNPGCALNGVGSRVILLRDLHFIPHPQISHPHISFIVFN